MKNGLISKPVPSLIRQIAIPSSIGFFFNTLYNVVDTYFGGQISTDALAALSLSFPVFFVIIAIGSGIATGATSLIANSLGAGDRQKANLVSLQAISFSLLFSVVLTAAGLLFSPGLFRILGAEGNYLALALEYTNIIFYGTALFVLNFTLNSILNAKGDTKTYSKLLVLGFFLNVILDPWFIQGGFGMPALGLAGVAWATFAIQAATSFFLLLKIYREGVFYSGWLGRLRPDLKYYLEIFRQGFPASLNMMTVAIGIFIITLYISKYGQTAVAAYGIATRFDQIALLPVIGLNIATLTLVGQNNGAKAYGRVREVVRTALKYGLSVTIAGMLLVILFSGRLVRMFSSDSEVITVGSDYLKVSALIYIAYTIMFISISAMQGLKKPNFAIWIGAYRQIAAPLPVFWVVSTFLGWGLAGIWWGIFLVNWTAAGFTLAYLYRILDKIGREGG